MPSPRVVELAALLQWQPRNTSTLSWETVQERSGITFPADFKELTSAFGTGIFDHIVGVIAPAEDEQALAAFVRDMRETLRLAKGNKPLPYRLFPDPDGLIPWGRAGDGCTLFWRTDRGGPEEWTVVFCNDAFAEWEEFDGSASEFIFELISGRIETSIIDFEPVDDPRFVAQP